MSTKEDTERSRITLPLPDGVVVETRPGYLAVRGPLGRVERPFPTEAIGLEIAKGEVTLALRIPSQRKRSQSLLRTWAAHVKNLTGGLTRGVEAKMKVVAAHFPMKVQAKESELVIENFLGEKYPRTAPLRPGVSAEVDGDFVVLRGYDVEQVGQSAANIERATHIRDYDPRVFQDGIYIIEKAHLKEAS
ncbi:MAG: 50S ribosomal protein L6 [Thermoplasmata archaeon]